MTRLHVPDEPTARRASWRRRLDAGEPLAAVVHGEDSVADWYWGRWQALDRLGVDRRRFGRVVAGIEREVGLWLRGERTHRAVASSLAGRVARRLPPAPESVAPPPAEPRGACVETRLAPALARCA